MPSKSKAQARFVAAKAARGAKWAKEWHKADKKRGTKHLPARKRR
jgi:hypothetical protein